MVSVVKNYEEIEIRQRQKSQIDHRQKCLLMLTYF